MPNSTISPLFEIDKILGRRLEAGLPVYRIKFVGCEKEVWVQLIDLVGCLEMVKRYEKSRVWFQSDMSDCTSHIKKLLQDVGYPIKL